tara:strand:- start:192 stop:569 length:378 start_codon:yes stop_codon:yes gene_type:complete
VFAQVVYRVHKAVMPRGLAGASVHVLEMKLITKTAEILTILPIHAKKVTPVLVIQVQQTPKTSASAKVGKRPVIKMASGNIVSMRSPMTPKYAMGQTTIVTAPSTKAVLKKKTTNLTREVWTRLQ